MTTRTHRIIRKFAPYLNRVEPYAIFVVYIAAGIMAFFAWVFPPKVAEVMGDYSTTVEAILLTVGCILGLWGNTIRNELLAFWGLISVTGGVFILFSVVIAHMIYNDQWNYGQFAGIILLALSLMFAHGFKLYHEITESWINLPPATLNKIYDN